ncbi:glycosyltransferase [Antarcticibacterium sp. 1MA-6-2]|uniref:glycosyltransferase n=1 Tax=Antarcticibacterium sp. 1MA-6-2 TaxID=2908210 RepID=UPI001F3F18FA|nr:glycosyltransferase [Antarcticibacterium sp. 1MA-6-2]UJH91329.1 glycosyltransferase [Antarcticibacterium sp. 1MA-6-2]
MTFSEFKFRYEKKEVERIPSKTPEKPLLSICIQTYNHSNYLRRCLDSILNQEVNFDFEILIGEDDSSDSTRELCLKYAEKFPDIIRLFLHNRENQISILGRPSSNFNAFYNLFSAKGKYIATCDGDDYWDDPLKAQKQVDFLENNPHYFFSYHSYKEVDKEGNLFADPQSLIQPKEDISAEVLKKGESHPLLLTICFRNKIREIPEEILTVLNVDTFLLSLFGQHGGAKYLSEIKPAYYRKHGEGIWSSQIKKVKFLSKIRTFRKLTDYYSRIEEPEMKKHYQQKLQKIFKMYIVMLLRKGEFREAFEATLQMRKIINLYP